MNVLQKIALSVACIALLGVAGAAEKMSKTECLKSGGHQYGPWYKQAAMYYLPSQPAHICERCGSFQNASGRLMQLVKDGKDGLVGGHGVLTLKEAEAALDLEISKDFTKESYQKAQEEDRYYGTP